MSTMTFQINDASTGGTGPAVWVNVMDNGTGTLTFDVTQQGGVIGDLRGLFFDIADESLLKSLTVTANSADIRIGNDSIRDLGEGANMNGLLGSDGGYDIGIEVGTSGIGKDDVRSFSFTLASSTRPLTLQDLSGVDFGARLTSVGMVSGSRADSAKLAEITSQAMDADIDIAHVAEDSSIAGNVLSNDAVSGGTTAITGWTGGDVGEQIRLSSAGDVIARMTLNADGSYSLDAAEADSLSEGEHIIYDFQYSARNQTEATSWSTDTASFKVVVSGKNDGPDAQDDHAGSVDEDGLIANASVGANDSDVDRLDTHVYSLVENSFTGLGKLTFNADGTWSYDAENSYDHLNDGEYADISFSYAMTDNHGASDTAMVSFRVNGAGSIAPPPPPQVADDFPLWNQDISNFTLVFDQTAGDIKPRPSGDGFYTVKIDVGSSFNDDLDASIATVLTRLEAIDQNIDESSDLIGVVIKGGTQTTSYYAYAEGNTNGTAPDLLPAELGFDLPGGSGNVTPTNAVDAGYSYDFLMAA